MSLHWSDAKPADEPALLALIKAFYAEERLRFEEGAARAALCTLFAQPAYGYVFLLRQGSSEPQGYLVLTLGFSLEFGGRFVLLDEVYLAPAVRDHGWGKRAVGHAEAWAREQGVAALRLEVRQANVRAHGFYTHAGFSSDQRDLMTRWL